jgi:hypothetical protein
VIYSHNSPPTGARKSTFVACFALFTLLVTLPWMPNLGLSQTTGVVLKNAVAGFPGEAALPAPKTERVRVAEGEYEVYEQANRGAFGPFGEEVYDFHETWTLWRVTKDRYEVDGEQRFQSPRDMPHTNRFVVQLSRDLTVIRMTDFASLRWRPDSGPLACEFLPRGLHCFSGAEKSKHEIDLRIPMEHPFGFLWPISVFSLSGIARQAERDLSRATPIQLVSIEQPSAAYPVKPTVLDGELRYLGEEDLQLAGQKWRALKFSIKVALHPQLLMWTSPKGLLLALAAEHEHKDWPQEGLRLVRFRQLANF